jgi:hypothetical protein
MAKKREPIKLGSYVKCSKTEFEGVAMQRIEYLDAPPKIGVQPITDESNKLPDMEYIPETMLKIVDRNKRRGYGIQ